MTQCIIPAAGMSSRFNGLGDLYQKFLLPYLSKPIIIHNLEIISKIEKIELITIVLNCEDDFSEKFILTNLKDGKIKNILKFKYYDNKKYGNGPLSTILFGIEDNFDSYIVILSDIILPKEFDITNQELSFISTVQVNDPSRWCISFKRNNQIEFIDKPSKLFIEELEKDKSKNNSIVNKKEYIQVNKDLSLEKYTALTGVYYFSEGKIFKSSVGKIIKSDLKMIKEENEISKLLNVYISKYKSNFEFKEKLILIKDCGTIDDFIKLSARANAREFNSIKVTNNDTIEKSCNSAKYNNKINDEINWYLGKPKFLDQYTPRLINFDFSVPKYEIERISDRKLSDILLYYNRDLNFWKTVGDRFFKYFKEVEDLSPKFKPKLKSNMKIEIIERFSELDQLTKQKISLEDILKIYSSIEFFKNDEFYHGDLNLSNVFYNSESSSMKFIDPKGGLIGNRIYDLAKITQCLVFGYDFIKNNLYFKSGNIVQLYDKGLEEISRQWIEQITREYGSDVFIDCMKLTGILFLKMVPLHYENPEHQDIFRNIGIEILDMFMTNKSKRFIRFFSKPKIFINHEANNGAKILINYKIFDLLKIKI